MVTKPKPKPFKLSNFLVYKEGFREIMDSGWNVHIKGYAMYRVVKRLKGLKSPFSKLLHNHGNLHDRVNKIRIELDEAQKVIDRDPYSSVLYEEHAHYLLAFKEALLDEERLLQQKAKVEWLKAGDSNTSYFHKIVKSKCARNRIEIVSNSSNNFYDGNQADCMVRDVTDDEIKSVMFSMGDDKASGPDGFTVAFFKKAWDVVGGDITCAIRDFFFSNGKHLKELNHAIISLIPKVTTLARINDYRPISCYNVLYKCISKIIANRVKEGLGDIVSINQSAFVPGRRISDNILLTQELMRNYHRRRGPPSINGNVHGWFKGKRGLRQGDPLSPYLFTLVMEILTLLLQRKVRNSDEFQYHHLCEQQIIINLCFADDLFLFARGHPSSVSVIMDALEEFKQVSGLVPSIPKSIAYFCNVPNAIKASILNSMPFAEGVLPVREIKKGKAKAAWDSVCIPKHEGGLGIRRIDDFNIALMATHIWKVMPVGDGVSFSILDQQSDLLFGIRLTMVWSKVRVLCGMDAIPPHLSDVVAFIVPLSKGKTVVSIISRIVVAATSYYIWMERNGRLFKKKTSTPGQIVDVIFSTVRLKLVTFKFKKMSTKSRLLLDQWKIPRYCIVHDGSIR
ncbi:sodium/hydrogen exchanger 6 [Tanacetum coccineum]